MPSLADNTANLNELLGQFYNEFYKPLDSVLRKSCDKVLGQRAKVARIWESAFEMLRELQERAKARNQVAPDLLQDLVDKLRASPLSPRMDALTRQAFKAYPGSPESHYQLGIYALVSWVQMGDDALRESSSTEEYRRWTAPDGIPTYITDEQVRQRQLIRDLLMVQGVETQALRELQIAGLPDSEIIRLSRMSATDPAARLLINQMIDQYLPGRVDLVLTIPAQVTSATPISHESDGKLVGNIPTGNITLEPVGNTSAQLLAQGAPSRNDTSWMSAALIGAVAAILLINE